MDTRYEQPELVFCDCHTGAVAVWHDPDGEFTELSFWEQSYPGRRYSIRQRLRGAWTWLRGRPYSDMVILTDAERLRLVAALHRAKEFTSREGSV